MKLVRRLDSVSLEDIPLVGGKNASLGEMIRSLAPLGVRVPDGFALTSDAYRATLDGEGVRRSLRDALSGLDPRDLDSLRACGLAARRVLREAPLPPELIREIDEAYVDLSRASGEEATDVAVRSSATAEDLPTASFAGQQETYLNVHGLPALLDACRRCFASLYTDRAIFYRAERGYEHDSVELSVGVQKMVRSDLAGSGVMFTLDTESGFDGVVLVTAVWGLGENIVQGVSDPDEHLVFKATGREISRRLGAKQLAMVYDEGGSRGTRNQRVSRERRAKFVLSREEVEELARQAVAIEKHYSEQAGESRPMDVEWAKDGRTGDLYVVQARPETTHAQRDRAKIVSYALEERSRVLVRGRAVGSWIGAGRVARLDSAADLDRFTPGSVLVAPMTDPDWEPILKTAAAVVTDHGGRTCHAAIVSRELGIPCVVGTGDATQVLSDGEPVTVSCAEGETGLVMEGLLAFERHELDVADLPPTRTKIYANVGDPERAFELAALPVDGVGLARVEFIIANRIGIHPLALLHPERTEPRVRREIEERTRGFRDGADFFQVELSQGVARIAAAFHPRPVVVRLSDFKSNEYAGLLGGAVFEVEEENPMLGFRGASRYTHPLYREAFALECRALRKVREQMGLENLIVMVPFCRTVDEAARVQKEMEEHGLRRGVRGLEIFAMCEIPANVLRIDAFSEYFDGFSIGSNDLTQLVLGVDRDSELLGDVFDERDPAVMRAIELAIEGAHRAGRTIGICGQAPSDHPELAERLVALGIDSLSLSPDVAIATRLRIAEFEAHAGRNGPPGRK